MRQREEYCLERAAVAGGTAAPRSQRAVSTVRYGRLLGRAAVMQRLFTTLRKLEETLFDAVIVGESGTGKELVARAIHEHSSVANGPFVAVNCGALQREFVRSELFGHRRGAFTGAVESRDGAFHQADGGTLFLDEVGELPLDVQPMLLRALQEREVARLGETNRQKVHVRLLAATHRDLEDMVRRGTFREDLYYRLNVVRIAIPPLRERPEDVEVLALEIARRHGAHSLPAHVLDRLHVQDWPGNVRELEHAVASFLAVGELPCVRPSKGPELESALLRHIDLRKGYDVLKREFCETFLITYLRQLMGEVGGNVTQAARLSGLERSYLNKLVLTHGLRWSPRCVPFEQPAE